MNLDQLHMSRLATWVVQQFGQALLVSTLLGLAMAAFGVLADAAWLVTLTPLACLLVFGLVLRSGEAPNPYSDEELSGE